MSNLLIVVGWSLFVLAGLVTVSQAMGIGIGLEGIFLGAMGLICLGVGRLLELMERKP